MAGVPDRAPMSDVQMVTVCPSRIICTTSGKVILSAPTLNGNLWQQFAHPGERASREQHVERFSPCPRFSADFLAKSSSEVSDRDLEVCGVYSLAQTLIKCLPTDDAALTQPIKALLEGMKRGQVRRLNISRH